jgi:hypothetical protein
MTEQEKERCEHAALNHPPTPRINNRQKTGTCRHLLARRDSVDADSRTLNCQRIGEVDSLCGLEILLADATIEQLLVCRLVHLCVLAC